MGAPNGERANVNFRSYADLNQAIALNLHKIFAPVDLVVGIPRSGLLAANFLSVMLNAPLADLDTFLDARFWTSGKTKRHGGFITSMDEVRHVLIIDDSIANGFAMSEARRRTRHLADRFEFTFAAVYGERASHPEADLVFEVVRQPRMFQWNFMHHDMLADTMVDIDGVLCLDPRPEENDDGAAYRRFVADARHLFTPTRTVGALVTNRLEKYRADTEAWLERRGIRYGALHMLDVPTLADRRALPPGSFKGEVYRSSTAKLFIESEAIQADAIARHAGKPVLCLETWSVHTPESATYEVYAARQAAARAVRTTPKKLKIAMKRSLRGLIGEGGYDQLKRVVRPNRD